MGLPLRVFVTPRQWGDRAQAASKSRPSAHGANASGPGAPGKGDLAKAMRYALTRGPSFICSPGLHPPSVAPLARPIATQPGPEVLDDSRVAIDNNCAERAIKPVGLGRKNFLCAASDAGIEILADAITVLKTVKLSGLDRESYLTNIFRRIRQHVPKGINDLLPWTWKESHGVEQKAA